MRQLPETRHVGRKHHGYGTTSRLTTRNMGRDNRIWERGGLRLLPTQPGTVSQSAYGEARPLRFIFVNRDGRGGYGTGRRNTVSRTGKYPGCPRSPIGSSRRGHAYWNGQIYVSGVADKHQGFPVVQRLALDPSIVTEPYQGLLSRHYSGGFSDGTSNGVGVGIRGWWLCPHCGAVLQASDALNSAWNFTQQNCSFP